MASEKDFELLDQYVGNRLSAQDIAVFEQKLAVDAELKNEFMLQQKVVDSIRKARASELKKLLSDIPMSTVPSDGASVLTQVGLWVVVAGVIGTGLYFYFRADDKPVAQQPTISEVIEEEQEPQIINPQEEAPAQQEDAVPVESDIPAKPQNKVAVTETTPIDKAGVKPVSPSSLDVFDPSEEMEKTIQADAEEENGETAVSTSPSIVVETANDKRYNFHYQFKNDKLYLYGSFEKNLYEIMEFFSDNKRTMFLFYKENYYLLNDETEKVRSLTPINDATLLKKLKDYRGN